MTELDKILLMVIVTIFIIVCTIAVIFHNNDKKKREEEEQRKKLEINLELESSLWIAKNLPMLGFTWSDNTKPDDEDYRTINLYVKNNVTIMIVHHRYAGLYWTFCGHKMSAQACKQCIEKIYESELLNVLIKSASNDEMLDERFDEKLIGRNHG